LALVDLTRPGAVRIDTPGVGLEQRASLMSSLRPPCSFAVENTFLFSLSAPPTLGEADHRWRDHPEVVASRGRSGSCLPLAMRAPSHAARAREQTTLAVSWYFSLHPIKNAAANQASGVPG
jgi:hypothetical protein